MNESGASHDQIPHPEGVIDFGERRRAAVLDRTLERMGLDPNDVIIDVSEAESQFVDISTDSLSPHAELEVEKKIDKQGYVKPAPSFADQVKDESRTIPFRYRRHDRTYAVTTEHEGLNSLWNALEGFLEKTDSPKQMGNFTPQVIENLRLEARSILDSLTFIGQKEYEEAVEGLGAYWRAYLDADPDNQLCIVAGATHLARHKDEDEDRKPSRKSDDWLREDVLLTFTDEELEKYDGRIFADPQDLTAAPDNAKIILLDDWSISGDTLRKVYTHLANETEIHEYIQAGRVEANLLTVSQERLTNGLRTEGGPLQQNAIPVKGYFKSHEATCPNAQENHAHVSGTHSYVNYGFRDSIRPMLKLSDMIDHQGKKHVKSIVPLMHVDSIYDDELIDPVISITDKARRIGYAALAGKQTDG